MVSATSLFLCLALQGSLQSIDLKPGTGDLVAANGDVVAVLYRGTLTDGTVFDDTRGKAPYAFRVGFQQVIAGWDKGILGMKVGSKRKLVIPPSLAYGDRESGSIPANSILTFEIEVLRIDKKDSIGKLIVKENKEGAGLTASAENTVTFHYTGSFLNSKEFDSSRKGSPLTYPIQKLIPGMQQALTGMKVGGKKTVIVPFNLGYGEKGIPGVIPRFATLVFEFELLDVQ